MDFADWRGLFVAEVLESFWGIGCNLFEVFLWRDIMKMLQGATVMLQTEMDKSFKIVNLLWIFMKGICYGKATQTV